MNEQYSLTTPINNHLAHNHQGVSEKSTNTSNIPKKSDPLKVALQDNLLKRKKALKKELGNMVCLDKKI